MKNIVKNDKDIDYPMELKDLEKGKDIVIVGAASSVKTYLDRIKSFIDNRNAITIGINKMSDLIVPDYHVWTNKQRWLDYGKCTNRKSTLIYGSKITKKMISKVHKGKSIHLDYEDTKGLDFKITDSKIQGYFRTAGTLSIAIAHLMGAENIFIVGMDGYTMHSKSDTKKGRMNQHCYGKGHTDDSTWQECLDKDNMVANALRELRDSIEFSILTPTVFKEYYKPDLL